MRMIDEIDRQILELLQETGRISNAEIARQVGMAPSAVLERIRKLEERRIIRGYQALLNPKPIARSLLAYILVRTKESGWDDETGRALAGIPDIQEVHHIAGNDCFLVKVRTCDTDSLGQLLRDRIGVIPSVGSTRTTIVLQTVKESLRFPVVPCRKEAE